MKITIVDYGAGNLKSIWNMFKRIGVNSIITNSKSDIESAEKLILPGVGHFDYGMQQLVKSELIGTIKNRVLTDKIPILGICLGAQMLGASSEEGSEEGLGFINMKIVKFDSTKANQAIKIPHMGWSELKGQKTSKLLMGYNEMPRFYFVHTYHMQCENKNDILATSNYGYEFASAVEKENIYGVQFHPEKSHKFGMQLLKNFAEI